MSYTNNAGVPLALAVWLVHDDYDHDDRPNYISVTELIKSVRQIVLSRRVQKKDTTIEVVDQFKSRLGQALHSAIERAWKEHYKKSLLLLGHPQKMIDRIQINPLNPGPDVLPVYIEQRVEKEFDGIVVGGKYDLIIEGRLMDAKSTSVYAYMNNSSIGKWKLQGSVYRLLNQDKIFDDHLYVQYLFTDWSRASAGSVAGYPATPVLEQAVQLLSVSDTERYVRGKLQEIKQHQDTPEAQLPLCTEEDLWRDPPKYKFYGDPEKAKAGGRSTKNFDSLAEANMHVNDKGKGVIVTVPGQPKACNYCAAFNLCTQKDSFIRG